MIVFCILLIYLINISINKFTFLLIYLYNYSSCYVGGSNEFVILLWATLGSDTGYSAK